MLEFVPPDVGLCVEAWGLQREGKTAVLMAIALWLMAHGGYLPSEVASNQTIYIKGVRKFNKDEMFELLQKMIKEHVRHKVLLIAEADRYFPPRFWHDPEQSRSLIGLWQNEKLENWILFDTHIGGADVQLERTAQLYIVPHYLRWNDSIECEVISKINLIPSTSFGIDDVSELIFPYYDHKEPVD